jgi:hypothetical protein
LSDLSLEDLLSIVNEAELKKSREVKNKDLNSVDRFVNDLDIKTGLDKVPTHVIYYHYRRKWVDKNKDRKCNKIVFFRSFNKKFTQHRNNKQRYYLLNKDSFDLSREVLIEAENFDRKQASGKK